MIILPAVALALVACQNGKPAQVNVVPAGKSAGLRSMEVVATAAHRCWFASKDPAFKSYKFANELNAFGGQPRFLLVPAKNFGGRPLLVVQAHVSSSKVDAFGPLLSEPLGARISADLRRWTAGDTSCGAAA
ncbi:MAG: hypothetical protein KF914_06030 [Rhizobiaceae bacterium]|nr:hypothetical protein [Rhizobiaceae bacterium]